MVSEIGSQPMYVNACVAPDGTRIDALARLVAAAPSFAFQFGYRVMFEGATVVYDPWRKDPLFIYPVKGKPFAPKLKGTSPYAEEIHRFFDWSRGRTGKTPVENKDIRLSIALIAAERKAAATGRRVEFKA